MLVFTSTTRKAYNPSKKPSFHFNQCLVWPSLNLYLCRICSKFGSVLDIQSISQMGRTDQDTIFADIIPSMACCVHFWCRNIRERLCIFCLSSVGGQDIVLNLGLIRTGVPKQQYAANPACSGSLKLRSSIVHNLATLRIPRSNEFGLGAFWFHGLDLSRPTTRRIINISIRVGCKIQVLHRPTFLCFQPHLHQPSILGLMPHSCWHPG